MEGRGIDLLGVAEAAALLGVTKRTVFRWIHEGALACFKRSPQGWQAATRDEIRAARVLRPQNLRDKGIHDELLDRALRRRIVSSPDGRYSLNDVEAILAFGAAAKPTPNPAGPVRRQSGFVIKAFEWNEEMEEAHVQAGASVEKLPDGYFEVEGDPPLLTPPNVFLHEVTSEPVPGRPGARFVRRLSGYELGDDGVLRWCEQNDRFDILEPGESLKPEQVASNRKYYLQMWRMKRETYRRRRRLRRESKLSQ